MNMPLSCSLCSQRNADWGAFGCHISALPWICCIWAQTASFTLTASQLASQSGDSMSENCRLVAWWCWNCTHLLCTEQLMSVAIKVSFFTTGQLGKVLNVGLKGDWQEVNKITWMSPEQEPDFFRLFPLPFYSFADWCSFSSVELW